MRYPKSVYIVIVALLLGAGQLSAQTLAMADDKKPMRSSRIVIGDENQLLMPVNVIGKVQKPGQYLIPVQTDLMALIASAGGLEEDARISHIRIIRGIQIEGRTPVREIDLKKYIETGDKRHLAQIRPDDTIYVPGTKTSSFKKSLELVGKLAVVAQLYFYVKVASER